MNCGKPDQAMESMRASRERLNEINHDYSKVPVLSVLSTAWFIADDSETAQSVAEEALEVAEGRGFHSAEAMAWIMRGWARGCQGELDEGVENVERGLALAETSGSDVVSPVFFIAAAHAHRMAKNRERAEELIDLAAEVCERDGFAAQVGHISTARALIHYEFGDEILETENLFRQAVDDADQFEMRWHGLISSTHLARIAPRTGKIREAHDRLALQLGRITEGLDRALVREARAALDELAGLLDA